MSIHFLTNGKVGKWSWPRGSTNRKSRMIVNTIIQSESLYLTLIYMPMWPSWIITWCVHTRPITVRICLQPIRRPDFARFIFDHEFDPIGGQTKVNPCQMAGSIKSYFNWLIQTANQNKDAERSFWLCWWKILRNEYICIDILLATTRWRHHLPMTSLLGGAIEQTEN